MEDADILQEFLMESSENLARLDQEMVELERHPDRQDLLAGIFRTVHTVKGTCGFFGFTRLERLTHVSEDILNDLRQGNRRLDGALASLILEAVDGIKRFLASIQTEGGEGEPFEDELIERLQRARDNETATPVQAAAPAVIPPVPVPEADAAASQKTNAVTDTALRVDIGLLDRLMNLAGELVLTRNQVVQYRSARGDPTLNTIFQRLNLITTELQEAVMKTRMQPIGVVWNKLPRIVRDLAKSLGKEIDLEMDGADTELDRTIIEAIKDPLIHIVRNSCDHGIEDPKLRLLAGKPAHGLLSLRAYHEGGQVNIEIADDGAGIDPRRVKAKAVERQLLSAEQAARLPDRDAISLVFLPGFSTSATVTNVSGRGVGMDVVKTSIERIGGVVEMISEPGHGAKVRVRIPLTLAIIPGLVVSAGGQRFVIPQVNLHELIRVEGDATGLVEYVHSAPVFRRCNTLLPLVNLSEVLRLSSHRPADEISIVVLQTDEHRFGLIVDQIGDSQEIVVKPLWHQLKGLNCYAGATIMGDGRIALILDIAGIGLRSGVIEASGSASKGTLADEAHVVADERSSLLLCRAGSYERLAIPLSQVARLERIPASNVELAAGRAAVQYRERILPLVDVAAMLGSSGKEQECVNVVVYRGRSAEFGLVVDEILDIVVEQIGDICPTAREGLLGSAVVGGRVTDFLDVEAAARCVSIACPDGLARLHDALSVGPGERLTVEVCS